MTKHNPEQRRRDICGAAVELLAADGIRRLTHLNIDRRLNLPDGSTSFYYRTRAALVLAVADWVTTQDFEELRSATAQRPKASARRASGLATLVVSSSRGTHLQRSRARYELAMEAGRDAELAEVLYRYADAFHGLIRDVVEKLRPEHSPLDPQLVEAQAQVVKALINGIMFGYLHGERAISTAKDFDAVIAGVVAGISTPGGLAVSQRARTRGRLNTA